MPLVKLLDTHVVGRPGSTVIAFGHTFTIQANGDATADIHEDFIKAEVAAGRYKVIQEPIKVINPNDIIELNVFTFELDQYYGAGSLDKLMKQIAPLRKELIEEFASSRLQITLQPSMTKRQMLRHISTVIESKIEDKQNSKDGEDDLSSDNGEK